tara:strand:+ start:218 stop:1765 length:1548 start_codon:yes stop_codon:yes gene_type:complete
MAIRFEYGPPPSALGALAYQSGVQQAQDRRRRELEALQVQAAQMRQQRQQANLERQFSAWKTQYGHNSALSRMKADQEWRDNYQDKTFTHQKELTQFQADQRRRESLASSLVAQEQKRLEAEQSRQHDLAKQLQSSTNALELDLVKTFNERGHSHVKLLREQRDNILSSPKASPQDKIQANQQYYQKLQQMPGNLKWTEPLGPNDPGFRESLKNGLQRVRMPDGQWGVFANPDATEEDLAPKVINGQSYMPEFNKSDGRFVGWKLVDPDAGEKPPVKMTVEQASKDLFQIREETIDVGTNDEQTRKVKEYSDHGLMMADLYKRSGEARQHWNPLRVAKDHEDFVRWYRERSSRLEEPGGSGEPEGPYPHTDLLHPASTVARGAGRVAGELVGGASEQMARAGMGLGQGLAGMSEWEAARQGVIDEQTGDALPGPEASQQRAWEALNQEMANVKEELQVFGDRATPELINLLERARGMQDASPEELENIRDELRAEVRTIKKTTFNKMEDEFRGIV